MTPQRIDQVINEYKATILKAIQNELSSQDLDRVIHNALYGAFNRGDGHGYSTCQDDQ